MCKQIKPTQVSKIQLPGDLGTDEIELNTVSSVNHNMMYKCLKVNNTSVRFLVGTGSPVSFQLNGRAQMVSQFNDAMKFYAAIRAILWKSLE